MQLKSLLCGTFTLAVFVLKSSLSFAQQPFNGCWHPNHVKEWTPEKYPDSKFNISKVPLAKRFKEPQLMKANPNQSYTKQLTNATILYPMCGACPSQGAFNFVGYQPTYWQYMDKVVYWAGSAGEGIINIPPVWSTDAAHQSGVKILGNINFQPSYYGGRTEWVRQIVSSENDFHHARQLYKIAKYYGFDGWFINDETGGATQEEMIAFINAFYRAANEDGNTNMEIQYYAGHQTTPRVAILKTNENTSHFLDYGGVNGSLKNYAGQLGCTPEETYGKIFAGVECVKSGLTGYGSELSTDCSLALFCPEEHIWKKKVEGFLSVPNSHHGTAAYQAMARVFQDENLTWTNSQGDPSNTAGYWQGVSGTYLEHSAITEMPFQSSFCVGMGKHRFVRGVKKGTHDWWHSGVQSIMPTWRYWIENKGDITVSEEWEDVYNLGSSLRIRGTLSAGEHLMRLYKTQLNVVQGGKLRIVYKTSYQGSVEVKLSTASSIHPDKTLSNVKSKTDNGWTIDEYDLASLDGQTIYMIALNLKAASDLAGYNLILGELAVLPKQSLTVPEVTNFTNQTELGEVRGDLRLTWDYQWNQGFDRFDVYMKQENGDNVLIGQTRSEGFYIPFFERENNAKYVTVELHPVMKDGTEGETKTLQVDFPSEEAPKPELHMTKNYVTIGEEVTIDIQSTGLPTSFKWILPSSLMLVKGQLTDRQITVKTTEIGMQEITVEVGNSVGTTTKTFTAIEVMDANSVKDVQNVALQKTVVSFSGSTNAIEVPDNILNGVRHPNKISEKWCQISNDFWMIIDLGGAYDIYGFGIWDCKAGPELNENFDSYRIYISDDGKNWKPVVDQKGRIKDNIKYDYIAPQQARYVKLNPYNESGQTLRIWEFEVYGKDQNKMTVEVDRPVVKLQPGEKQDVVVSYSLNGDPNQGITCTAKAMGAVASVGQVVENGNGTFTLPVLAAEMMGKTDIEVYVANGKVGRTVTIHVVVDDTAQPNILNQQQAELREYAVDYTMDAEYKTHHTLLLTDGDVSTDALRDNSIELQPQKNKEAFWTVFKGDEPWNLIKVRVHLPNHNKGLNDNDEEGFVNQTISIRVSDDGRVWETLKVFEHLEDVSVLEYMLPEYKTVTYLAVSATVNPYFYPSMAEVEAFEQLSSVIPSIKPVTISQGWNADVIAEQRSANKHTSESIDSDGWVFYTQAVDGNGGLPTNGKLTDKKGVVFQLSDYTKDNALILTHEHEAYPLIFDKPFKAEELYVLATATNVSAYSSMNISAKVYYEDGSTEQTALECEDWIAAFGGMGESVYGLGRMMRSSGGWYKPDDICKPRNVRLFTLVVPTDKSRNIEKVEFERNSDGRAIIFAVTKKGYKDIVNSIDHDVVTNPDRKVIGIFTIDGLSVRSLQKGINIVRYSDGKAVKVLVR